MSVVINTNFAATLAANNLASSNQALQKSLSRLSSGSKIVNPADDAGGLAVSMKLSAAARRQGAAMNNIGSSISFLQTQDGALKTYGKVLERIGELKTLASDPTKNASDLANYNAEFIALQDQLSSLAGESFNGKSLFGSDTLSVSGSENGGGGISFGGTNILGVGSSPGFSPFSDDFNNLTNWTTQATGGSNVANTADDLDLNSAAGGTTSATSTQTFSGAFEVQMQIYGTADGSNFTVELGGQTLASFTFGSGPNQIPSNGADFEDLTLSFDGNGTVNVSLNGSALASQSTTATSGALTLRHDNPGGGLKNLYFDSISVTSIPGGATSASTVANAADLSSLSLSAVTGALQEIATFRAENGAQQSRLGYAAEVLATNKANLEAANSRIVDVDVAEESTQLARYNILVQAGTAMLSQANQSAQTALRLIG